MPRAALAGILLAALQACASAVYADAEILGAAADPARLQALRAVRLEWDPDAGDPLRDRIVGELAAAELGARGVVLDGAAEARLIAHGYREENERWIAPQTRVVRHWSPSRRWAYAADPCGRGGWITVWDSSGWETDLWTVPGRTVTDYAHGAEIVLMARDGAVLWIGEVRASSRTGDFRRVMDACIPLLFGEYPAPSGQPSERRVSLPAAHPTE